MVVFGMIALRTTARVPMNLSCRKSLLMVIRMEQAFLSKELPASRGQLGTRNVDLNNLESTAKALPWSVLTAKKPESRTRLRFARLALKELEFQADKLSGAQPGSTKEWGPVISDAQPPIPPPHHYTTQGPPPRGIPGGPRRQDRSRGATRAQRYRFFTEQSRDAGQAEVMPSVEGREESTFEQLEKNDMLLQARNKQDMVLFGAHDMRNVFDMDREKRRPENWEEDINDLPY